MRLSFPICEMGRLYKGTVRTDEDTKDRGRKTPQRTLLEGGYCCEDFQSSPPFMEGVILSAFCILIHLIPRQQYCFYYHYISEETGALEMK